MDAGCRRGMEARVTVDRAVLAADLAALVQIPIGHRRGAGGADVAGAEGARRLGLEAELVEHDLAALRAHPDHPGEEAARTSC